MADIPAPASAPPATSTARSSGLAIAAAIVAFGFLGSRLLGVVRATVIARAFGATPDYDAYLVAFRIPDYIFQVLAGATLGSAFIPVFSRLTRREGDERAWDLASKVLNLVTLSTAALCVVAFILAPWLVPLTAPGLQEEGKAIYLTRIMLLSPLLFSVSGMLTGILNGRQKFLLPAIAPMVYNLSIIAGAVFLSGPFGVEGLTIGVLTGAGLHLLVQVPGLFQLRMTYHFVIDTKDAAVREVGRLMAPRVAGLAATQFNFLVDIFFGSKIGEGTIANLNYAWTVAQLPTALFGMALSTAVFPRLADHAADDDVDELLRTVSRVLRVIMFLSIPAAVGLAMLRFPVVVLLFERGSYTSHDSYVTAATLGFYCLGIVPQAGIEIHSRGFYALGNTRTPVMLAVTAVVVNIILSSLLWKEYEYRGLAFANACASWIEWTLLYTLFSRKTRAPVTADLASIARMGIAAAVMALFLAIAFWPIDHSGRLSEAVIALSGALAGVAVYVAMAHWLGIPELRDAVSRVRGRLPA